MVGQLKILQTYNKYEMKPFYKVYLHPFSFFGDFDEMVYYLRPHFLLPGLLL